MEHQPFLLIECKKYITVVTNNGNDLEPVEVDRLLIAVLDTYNVIDTIPNDSKAYEYLETPEYLTISASLKIGKGVKQFVSPLPKLNYFESMKMMNEMKNMNGNLNDMNIQMSLNQMELDVVMNP